MDFLNFKYANFSVLLILVLVTSACDWLKTKKEEVKNYWTGITLINVNDKASFDDARISGSIHMSLDDIAKQSKNLNKNDTLVVYCTDYSCSTSEIVANELVKLGFEKTYVYPGGIQEWYQLSLKDSKAYPFEGEAKQPFLNKPIEKFERDGKIQSISAQDLSNLLLKSRK